VNTSVNTSAYMTANTIANTSAYMTANTSANTSANMNANVDAFTEEEACAYTRRADYEDAPVDTVKRKLYTRKEEQDDIDPPDVEDDSRTLMFKSHSETLSAQLQPMPPED
jgi:hypothetical protein